MAKNRLVYVFAFVLLLAIVVGCISIFQIGKGIYDSFETLYETDTQTDVGSDSSASDTSASDTSTSGEAAEPHVITLGDDELMVVDMNDGTVAMLGFSTTELKPHTKYRVTWKIDGQIIFDIAGVNGASLPIDFIKRQTPVGHYCLVKYSIDFDKVTDNGEEFDKYYFSSSYELIGNEYGREFVSGDLGDCFSIYFFTMEFEGVEGVIANKKYVTQYITEFTLTDVLE